MTLSVFLLASCTALNPQWTCVQGSVTQALLADPQLVGLVGGYLDVNERARIISSRPGDNLTIHYLVETEHNEVGWVHFTGSEMTGWSGGCWK